MEIKVEIDINDYPKDWNLTPSMWEMWIVGKLKDAGVPVNGKLIFRGIKSGVLKRLDDPANFSECVYIWKDK